MRQTSLLKFGMVWLGLTACTTANPEFDPTQLARQTVFLTDASFLGGELSNANPPGAAQCQAAAEQAQLPGRYVAWLSSQRVVQVDAVDTIEDNGPWYDRNGILIFANKQELGRTPQAPLRLNEWGFSVNDGEPVWTGTFVGGSRSEHLCFDPLAVRVWYALTEEVLGDIGRSGRMDEGWTYAGAQACSKPAHLICIQQPVLVAQELP